MKKLKTNEETKHPITNMPLKYSIVLYYTFVISLNNKSSKKNNCFHINYKFHKKYPINSFIRKLTPKKYNKFEENLYISQY
jgi:hypothetical protein